MTKKIKLRAHHLNSVCLQADKTLARNNEIRGMYGQRMLEHQVELQEQIRTNPNLKVEIIDDFDSICVACPKGPNKIKYILPDKDIYDEDDRRGFRFWSKFYNNFWQVECTGEKQKEKDREIGPKEFGLAIGTVITAKQASEISKIYNKYFGDFWNYFLYDENKLRSKCHMELKTFYEREGIEHLLG
jgi:hypothetical protein